MSNAKVGTRFAYGSWSGLNDRRAKRAERQFLLSNIAVVVAFVFVSALVFGVIG